MMEYVYAGMWFLIGLLLIWKLRKENQVFVFAGGIFLFMGAWWLADALLPQPNFHHQPLRRDLGQQMCELDV